MTSLIALFIALTFGTANVEVNNMTQPTQELQYSNDDGVGISTQGGQKTEQPGDPDGDNRG